jgi:hypothetical protein
MTKNRHEHPIKGKSYMTFTPDHDEKHAIKRFVSQFGKEPEVVFRHNNGQLWIGPEEVDNEATQ